MNYLRIHTGPDGESRFEDVAVALRAGGGQSDLSDTTALAGLVFARLAPGYERDLHNPPQRQFVVTLAGAGEVTAGSGERRALGTGAVMLAEDMTGNGHLTRTTSDGPWQAVWLVLPGGVAPAPALPVRQEPFTSYFRIYAGADGESHFEDVAVMAATGTEAVVRSVLLPATGLMFRRSRADQYIDWHPAPRRQFVITLSGEAEVEASDGEVRPIRPGTVMLAEDLTGKGHITRAVGDVERLSLFVPLV